jgi:integrase
MTSPRRHLTDDAIKKIKPGPKRLTIPDPDMIGHYLRVTPNGAKSLVVVVRDPFGKQIWTTIDSTDHITIEDSRAKAREIRRRVKAGLPATEPPPPAPDSFSSVAENWLTRHVKAKGLRTAGEIERCRNKYVFPHWGSRVFVSIGRSDIARLLDHIQDNHGARQADACLAQISSIMNWHASRIDGYNPPVVRGMRRTSTKESARTRILGDDELKAVWKAAEQNGQFGAFVRLALLLGPRRAKLATMRWSDIDEDGVWTIPTEAREKGTPGSLILPPLALDIIRAQPRIEGNPYVFHGQKPGQPFTAFWKLQKRFCEYHLPKMPRWTLHDLRRTSRSLASRAGVRPDVAERLLGHTQQGIAATYDRYSYAQEMAAALAAIASLIESIVYGAPTDKVVPMRKPR